MFLYEDVSGPFFRIVPLSRDVKRLDDSESYLGDAYGRWEGDTLVVETTNFNDLTWLTDDGSFHTDKLKVTERLVPVGQRDHLDRRGGRSGRAGGALAATAPAAGADG